MDPNENTKNGPGQSPATGAEPDVMQQESPRTCKICGGPNHHGCGCEARQRRAAVQVETENIKPESEIDKVDLPAKTPDDQRPTDAEIADTIERGEKLFGHIEAMSDNLSDLCAVMQESRDLLKMINDNILAQKIVEVKDAAAENKN